MLLPDAAMADDASGLRKRTNVPAARAAARSDLSDDDDGYDTDTALAPAVEDKIHSLAVRVSHSVFSAHRNSHRHNPKQQPGIPSLPQASMFIATLITIVALWTRLYKINWSPFVVWDEAHFGKFAGHYIKREFYFDVHPPLGKMLNGLAGLIAGFNGTFEFESGARYPPELSYGVMRFFNGLFGAFIAPLAYATAIHMHMSQLGAILVATFVIVENAICTISRFILLDSMLLFFTSLSAYSLVVFRNYQKTYPFSPEWFFWMFMTGVSLGAVLSVKWVGLFAIALVGLHTIEDLWEMLGDLKMPVKTYVNHWIARVVFLICVPMSIYMLSFVLHFSILNRSGPGDAQMSSLFQAGLVGNDFSSNPLEIAYGSKVTIKNNARGGGLLHSHVQTYPSGSEQQQVTTYHHKDSNNEFLIMKPWGVSFNDSVIEYVQDRDKIRLVHDQTKRNLHSHQIPAPVTNSEQEVSAYGNITFGDYNDIWIIEKVDDWKVGRDLKRIRSLTTRFRIRHQATGCLLRADGVTLPQWGFKQTEVVCQKKPDDHSTSNMWNIEQHWNSKLPPGGKNDYRSSFFRDFIDLNVAMWTSNNALTPDPDKEPDQLVSQPYHWPLMLRGLRICGWADTDIKYYLLGNPFAWWGSTLSLVVLVALCIVYVIRWRRGMRDFKTLADWDNFYFAAKIGLLGWFLHYFPFYIMGRVMYLHHYFPALYFALIVFGFLVDHLTLRLMPRPVRYVALALVWIGAVGVFLFFADFTFGMTGPASNYASRQWLKSWNIYGNDDN